MDDNKSVEFSLITNKNLRNQDLWKMILTIFFEEGHSYSPEIVDYGKKWVSLTSNNLSLVSESLSKANNILFKRENKFRSDLAFLVRNQPPSFNIMSLWIEEPYFYDFDNTDNFISTCKLLYNLLEPHYGLIHQTEDKIKIATIEEPKYGKTVLPINLNKGIPGIYWCNFFGPSYVDRIGRHRIVSAPSYRIEELNDGGFIVFTARSPLNYRDPDFKVICKELKKYLGEQFFYPN